jgi:Lipocalin-like domain
MTCSLTRGMQGRLLIVILAVILVGCGQTRQAGNAPSIVGSWKLMGMSREPFPIEKVTESDLMRGTLTFNDDGTFEGDIVYPQMPDKNLKVSGTYSVNGSALTITNRSNGSTTESTLAFEGDFMIATPVNTTGSIAYYKRLD